eukprot:scaffold6555_cov182-Amphora_coffeaeformis.AAC.9
MIPMKRTPSPPLDCSPTLDGSHRESFHSVNRPPSPRNSGDSQSSFPGKMTLLMKIHCFYLGLFTVYLLFTQATNEKFAVRTEEDASIALSSSHLRQNLPYGHSSSTQRQRKRVLFVPDCAKGLFVELLNERDDFLCSGILLRDDLIVADNACIMEAERALVMQPDEQIRLFHREEGSSLLEEKRVILGTKALNDWVALATIEMPQVHFHSGWPRNRSFVHNKEAHRVHPMWDVSSRVLELEDGAKIHLQCFGGHHPVILLPERTDGSVSSLLASSEDILFFPRDHKVAALSNALGEKWFLRKRSKASLLTELVSRRKLYMATDQNTTLDILRADTTSTQEYLLEAEDPRVRNAGSLGPLLQAWHNQKPFSGEPFFQWLDFGSGRSATYGGYTRQEIEEDFCTPMTDEQRAKAVVVPTVVDEEVILRYEVAGLPVEGGDMLFVWGLDSKIYVAPNEGSLFHHICFFHSMPVKMAGELVIGEHGALSEVWSDSGHYKPTEWHFRLFYRWLRSVLPDMTAKMVLWVNKRAESQNRLKAWRLFHFARY